MINYTRKTKWSNIKFEKQALLLRVRLRIYSIRTTTSIPKVIIPESVSWIRVTKIKFAEYLGLNLSMIWESSFIRHVPLVIKIKTKSMRCGLRRIKLYRNWLKIRRGPRKLKLLSTPYTLIADKSASSIWIIVAVISVVQNLQNTWSYFSGILVVDLKCPKLCLGVAERNSMIWDWEVRVKLDIIAVVSFRRTITTIYFIPKSHYVEISWTTIFVNHREHPSLSYA